MRPTFYYPFAGSYPVSSGFGPRGGGMHTGTDFSIPPDVEILASNDGQVIYAAYEAGGAGNTVTISGSDGWQSRYHHMTGWAVSIGQQIRAGELVGWCGTTGASSGPHLHFEIRSDPSTPVDPLPILQADAGTAPPSPGSEEPFTVGQMDDLAQWEKDTRKIILEQLIGSYQQGKDTGVLAQWSWDTRNYVDKAIKASEERIIAAINKT